MESSPEIPKEEAAYDQEMANRVRLSLVDSFDRNGGASGAVAKISQRLANYHELLEQTPEELKAALAACSQIEDKDEFVAQVLQILEPLLILKQQDPVRWETVARREFVRNGGFEQINDLLAYSIEGDTLHLHVPPNETTPIKVKINLIKDGLKKVAEVIKEHPEVEHIIGKSWIVASHGSLLERLGFTVEELSDEVKARSQELDPRDIALASISREELLKRYG